VGWGMSGEAGSSCLTTILGAGPRDLLGTERLDMISLRGGDNLKVGGDMEVGEPSLGARQESEEERVERLNDVRKRRALAVRSVRCGITTGGGR
jgi:hypothetical protein